MTSCPAADSSRHLRHWMQKPEKRKWQMPESKQYEYAETPSRRPRPESRAEKSKITRTSTGTGLKKKKRKKQMSNPSPSRPLPAAAENGCSFGQGLAKRRLLAPVSGV